MERYLQKYTKEKVLRLLTLRCFELCLENQIPDADYNDRRNAIENRFNSMEKDELIKLIDDDDMLIDILKNEICKNESGYEESFKNKPKEEALKLTVKECLIFFKHNNIECSDDFLIELRKKFDKRRKDCLLKLFNDKKDLLNFLLDEIAKK